MTSKPAWRIYSTRSPYRRGGLVFDGGRRVIELTEAELTALGRQARLDLTLDPAIEIEALKPASRGRQKHGSK